MRETNPFDILGVSPDVEPDEYWAAYSKHMQHWQTAANTREADQRIAELNWAIDSLEARRDEWVQWARSQPEPAGKGPRQHRSLPLLANVFVLVLVAGIGLLAWTLTSADDSGSSNQPGATSSQPGAQAPAASPGATGQATSAPTSVAPPPVPIDVAQVQADIRQRRQPPGIPPLQFANPISANLTGSGQPDVVIQWPTGGTCGNFIEVWGYLQGKVTNLSPKDDRNGNGFGCGGADVQDYLANGRQQIAIAARTYDPKQFSGGEYLVRTVWCWTGSEFTPVVSYYESAERQRLRTEVLKPQQVCK